MPSASGTFYGLVVRTLAAPTQLVMQMYLPTLPAMHVGPHPDLETAENLFKRYFDFPCTFIFWDGRMDAKVFPFPDNVTRRDLAAPGIWDISGNYASLGGNGFRVQRPFHGHHAAQYETEVQWLLLQYLADHRGKTIAETVMALPLVI